MRQHKRQYAPYKDIAITLIAIIYGIIALVFIPLSPLLWLILGENRLIALLLYWEKTLQDVMNYMDKEE